MLESRVNARDQLRVRFAGGWASVTASDGATLLEPIAAVQCEPRLYRVLNRVTIRVGADAVRLLPAASASLPVCCLVEPCFSKLRAALCTTDFDVCRHPGGWRICHSSGDAPTGEWAAPRTLSVHAAKDAAGQRRWLDQHHHDGW